MDATQSPSEDPNPRREGAGAMPDIGTAEAIAWLDGYKHAWESRDVAAALALFTPNANYRERRFGEPLLGHKNLESYWRDRVFEHQRDIDFSYELWGVRGNELLARWHAAFIWLPINGMMRLDGVMHVVFGEPKDGKPVGIAFNEWFDVMELK